MFADGDDLLCEEIWLSYGAPTNMIGFVATTTGNWQAVINKGGTMTFANTGVATTTTATGFSRMRVEVSSS